MQHWFAYPNIDPVAFRLGQPISVHAFSLGPIAVPAFSLGPIAVHWYGLSYLVGFIVVGLWMARPRGSKRLGLTAEDVQDLLVAGLMGILIGGRLFFVLADILSKHNAAEYFHHPLNIIAVWNGGMGFFGGLAGGLIAMVLFIRSKPGLTFNMLSDEVVVLLPIGIALTRIVNFINDELWGDRCVPDRPWCILFPSMPDGYRYPSQLFECALDIAVLPIVLFVYRARPADGVVGWTWFTLYGVTRFIAEYWRQTDIAVGPFTGGQLMALPMVGIGLFFLFRAFRENRTGDRPLAT